MANESVNAAESASSSEMRATVVRLIDAISAMDEAALRPLLADDAIMELPFAPPAFPASKSGGDAMAAGIGGAGRFFTKFRMTPRAFYPSPETNSIIVETDSEGTLHNGGSYSNRYIMLFRFRGNKIILWREYFNPSRVPALDL